jgi:hypothetical protein
MRKYHPEKRSFLPPVLALAALACGSISFAETLQGGVQQTQQGAEQNLMEGLQDRLNKLELEGSAKNTMLNGGAGQNGSMNPMQGVVTDQSQARPLNGSAANDPDGSELQIDWDRWRNTLTQSIQAGTINLINIHNDINFVFDQRRGMMVSRYPQGIGSMYSCDVLPNQQIINVRILQSSGNQNYDRAVFQAIMNLQGNPVLRYPRGSKRQIVTQQATVFTSADSKFQKFQFNDVETQHN